MLIEQQNELVRAIAEAEPKGEFERIVADVEIKEHASDYQIDSVMFSIGKSASGDFEDREIRMNPKIRDAIIALYKSVSETSKDGKLGGFELVIKGDGAYHFDFDYGPPKRINGVWDEEKERRLDHYLEDFVAGRHP